MPVPLIALVDQTSVEFCIIPRHSQRPAANDDAAKFFFYTIPGIPQQAASSLSSVSCPLSSAELAEWAEQLWLDDPNVQASFSEADWNAFVESIRSSQ